MNRIHSPLRALSHWRRGPLSLLAATACTAAMLASPAISQDSYVNYEVGAVSPLAIETFTFGAATRTVLMACNTANDALEFYDANTLTFLDSIPTGLAPVTVRWDAARSCAVTCNALGDSITCVEVTVTGAIGTTTQIDYQLKSTFRVGDEPQDIAFVPGTDEAIISLRSRSSVAVVNVVTRAVLDARHLLGVDNGANDRFATKNPRSLALVGNDRLYALDHQSDELGADMDLFVATGPGGGVNPLYDMNSTRTKVNELGTTHANFALTENAETMLVVGMRSTPGLANTEDAVGDLVTGFTQSWLWVVDLAPNTDVIDESLGNNVLLQSINLNRNYNTISPLTEVTQGDALAQPTGVAIVEVNDSITQVVLTAFSSDVVAILTPDSSEASGWAIRRVTLSTLNSSYSMVGPRDVVIDDAGQTAYVHCSMDNSIRVIDLATATETSNTSLLLDRTPQAIRTGREFLYAAKHSGNNMVSCSSCHIDGHTDAIAWTLNQPPQPGLPRSFDNTSGQDLPKEWPADKGPMVTQTLRGLVNHDVKGVGQIMFTNGPYHWRGDRKDFAAFNGAFVDLMNRSAGQLPNSDMAAYTTFVETMVHPPNPEQQLNRRLDGDMGGSGWDPAVGSGSQRGMKIYHGLNFPLSCAGCHVLPEGSGNRATQTFKLNKIDHPIEPAALRHVFDRESIYIDDPTLLPVTPFTVKDVGLFHDGRNALGPSLNHFVRLRFPGSMPGTYFPGPPTNPPTQAQLDHEAAVELQLTDLTRFVRGLDSGTAPIIGFVYTLIPGDANTNNRVFAILVDQVQEANAGMVAFTEVSGTSTSYWYDLDANLWREDAFNAALTPAQMTALATGSNVVVLQAVPVGSARRIADYGQNQAIDAGNSPATLTLEAMTPPTQWAEGGDLQTRWDPNNVLIPQYGSIVGQRESHLRQLNMQQAVLTSGAPNSFGLSTEKHELPRRFRVSGNNIRYGAKLVLSMTGRNGVQVPVEFPLFATEYLANGTSGPRIWETAVEADGEMTLAFLCGGYFLPNVFSVINFLTPTMPAVNPAADNSYGFTVVNLDGTSAGGTAPLTVRDDR